MTFEIGIIGTIIVIIFTVKYFRSNRGYWGKRDERRCEEENAKLKAWMEEEREEYRKRGESCYF